MSRTDVHLPWHVKDKDPYWKTQDSIRNHTCGCRLCTGHYDRIWNTRRTRAAQRAILTELVKYVQDGWDLDYHIPQTHKWTSFKSRYSTNVLGKGPAPHVAENPQAR